MAEGKLKMYPDHIDDETGQSASPPVQYKSSESSENKSKGCMNGCPRDLDSDAEKEDKPITNLYGPRRSKLEIVASVQAWAKGENISASVGEDGAKVERTIPEAFSKHQVANPTLLAAHEPRINNLEIPETNMRKIHSFQLKLPSKSKLNSQLIKSPILASHEEYPSKIYPRRLPPVEKKHESYIPQQPTVVDHVKFSQNYMVFHKPPRIIFEGKFLQGTLKDVAALNENYKDSISYTRMWLRPSIWVEVCSQRSKLYGMIGVTGKHKGTSSWAVKIGSDTYDIPIVYLRSHVPPVGNKVVILRGDYIGREATVVSKNDTAFLAEVRIRKNTGDLYSMRSLSLGFGYIAAVAM